MGLVKNKQEHHGKKELHCKAFVGKLTASSACVIVKSDSETQNQICFFTWFGNLSSHVILKLLPVMLFMFLFCFNVYGVSHFSKEFRVLMAEGLVNEHC